MSNERKGTYWDCRGRYNGKIRNQLRELIPIAGSVQFPRSKNKALERFRVAANYYYDLYNNGLKNRGSGFERYFGVSPRMAKESVYCHSLRLGGGLDETSRKIEDRMDQLIEAAAKEQGVSLEETSKPSHNGESNE